jgi:hypothetical protein
MRRLLLIAVAAAGLAGCSPTVASRVQSFSSPEFQIAGRTFAVSPAGAQGRSLAFETYANVLETRLADRGLAFSSGRARADTYIAMSYSSDGGRTFTEIVPVYAPVGGGHVFNQGIAFGPWGPRPFTSVGYVPPTMAVVGHEPVQRTVVTRQLRLIFTDARTGRVLHERTAMSQGGGGGFDQVALCMIEAVTEDFPGQPGLTRVVEVPAERCVARSR